MQIRICTLLSIYRYSSLLMGRFHTYLHIVVWHLWWKRGSNHCPHNNKRLHDKTCYFSTSIKTHLTSFWTQLDIDITESNMGDLLAGGTSSEAAGSTISDVLAWGPSMVWFHLHLWVQIVFVLFLFIFSREDASLY